MLRAKDVMTKDVISVKKTQPIYEAVEILTKHNVSGVPVVDDDMNLIGILSEKDASLKNIRILTIHYIREVLKQTLALLGIPLPERM